MSQTNISTPSIVPYLATATPIHYVDPTNNTSRKGRRKATRICAATSIEKVLSAVRPCLRNDYIEFLKMNLSRWGRDGLWRQICPQKKVANFHGYELLQKAYTCVYRLGLIIDNDPVRNRVAMLFLYVEYEKSYHAWKVRAPIYNRASRGVGRGDASSMIDIVLEKTHPEWLTSNAKRKADLRANFHDRKRYGKRWWILVNTLGMGILFICSPKLAAVMFVVINAYCERKRTLIP